MFVGLHRLAPYSVSHCLTYLSPNLSCSSTGVLEGIPPVLLECQQTRQGALAKPQGRLDFFLRQRHVLFLIEKLKNREVCRYWQGSEYRDCGLHQIVDHHLVYPKDRNKMFLPLW